MSDTKLDIERDKFLEWKEQQREAMRSACEDCENHNTKCPYFVLEDEEESEGYWEFEECFRDSGGWE